MSKQDYVLKQLKKDAKVLRELYKEAQEDITSLHGQVEARDETIRKQVALINHLKNFGCVRPKQWNAKSDAEKPFIEKMAEELGVRLN